MREVALLFNPVGLGLETSGLSLDDFSNNPSDFTENYRVRVLTIGIPGKDGNVAGNASFEHFQPVPSSEWIVNHNLGYFPNIQVRDLGGNVIGATIKHFSSFQARIYVNPAIKGYARGV